MNIQTDVTYFIFYFAKQYVINGKNIFYINITFTLVLQVITIFINHLFQKFDLEKVIMFQVTIIVF